MCLFELPPSLGCLLVNLVVDCGARPAVIVWLDEIRDVAYVLAEMRDCKIMISLFRGQTNITSWRESRAISLIVAIE